MVGPDGFMDYPLNPTDKARWSPNPNIRNAYRTMVPLAGKAREPGDRPTHFSWLFLDETPKGLPRVTLPDVWIVYRTNRRFVWEPRGIGEKMVRASVMVAFAYTLDETTPRRPAAARGDRPRKPAADPHRRLEVRLEQFWDCTGFALRQPAVATAARRAITAIATELAQRTGSARQVKRVAQQGRRRRAAQGRAWDVSLAATSRIRRGHLGGRLPRRERRVDGGRESHGLDWFREQGFATKPFPRLKWYLYPTLVERACASSSPTRSGCCG